MTNQVKFYQVGSFAVGNRLLDIEDRSVQSGAAPDRHRTADRRGARAVSARAGERARSIAADGGKLRRVPAIRGRCCGFSRLQRLRPFRFRRMALQHRRARRG